MKFSRMLQLFALPVVAILVAPLAHADAVYGPLNVTVWSGPGVTDLAVLPTPTGTPTATFTYTGPLDFVNNNGQSGSNTFADFLNSTGSTNYTSDISGYSSSSIPTLAGFLALTMSTIGETDGATNSYMEFTGDYTGGGAVSVSSDDGSSFYVNGSLTALFGNAGPQSDKAAGGTLAAGVNTPFTLVYVESNGAPSDLTVTGLTPTPEPGSLFLLGTGLLGLAGMVGSKYMRAS